MTSLPHLDDIPAASCVELGEGLRGAPEGLAEGVRRQDDLEPRISPDIVTDVKESIFLADVRSARDKEHCIEVVQQRHSPTAQTTERGKSADFSLYRGCIAGVNSSRTVTA